MQEKVLGFRKNEENLVKWVFEVKLIRGERTQIFFRV